MIGSVFALGEGTALARPPLDELDSGKALYQRIGKAAAQRNNIPFAIVDAVMRVESGYNPQARGDVGEVGLMQILPSTADYIARKSGGTAFEQGDLATPQINIAYGSWYLRYLLQHYHGNELLALAAYNAGEGKVDEWYRRASARGEDFEVATHIPFPETRSYVGSVLEVRGRYRQEYRKELGLDP